MSRDAVWMFSRVEGFVDTTTAGIISRNRFGHIPFKIIEVGPKNLRTFHDVAGGIHPFIVFGEPVFVPAIVYLHQPTTVTMISYNVLSVGFTRHDSKKQGWI